MIGTLFIEDLELPCALIIKRDMCPVYNMGHTYQDLQPRTEITGLVQLNAIPKFLVNGPLSARFVSDSQEEFDVHGLEFLWTVEDGTTLIKIRSLTKPHKTKETNATTQTS